MKKQTTLVLTLFLTLLGLAVQAQELPPPFTNTIPHNTNTAPPKVYLNAAQLYGIYTNLPTIDHTSSPSLFPLSDGRFMVNCDTGRTCFMQHATNLNNPKWFVTACVTNGAVVDIITNRDQDFFNVMSIPGIYSIKFLAAPNGALPYLGYEIPEYKLKQCAYWTITNAVSGNYYNVFSNALLVMYWQSAATNMSTSWACATVVEIQPYAAGGPVTNTVTCYMNRGDTCQIIEPGFVMRVLGGAARPIVPNITLCALYYSLAGGGFCDNSIPITNSNPTSDPESIDPQVGPGTTDPGTEPPTDQGGGGNGNPTAPTNQDPGAPPALPANPDSIPNGMQSLHDCLLQHILESDSPPHHL